MTCITAIIEREHVGKFSAAALGIGKGVKERILGASRIILT